MIKMVVTMVMTVMITVIMMVVTMHCNGEIWKGKKEEKMFHWILWFQIYLFTIQVNLSFISDISVIQFITDLSLISDISVFNSQWNSLWFLICRVVVYNAVNQRPATTVVGFLLFDPNIFIFFTFYSKCLRFFLLFDPNVYAFFYFLIQMFTLFFTFLSKCLRFLELILTLSLFRQNFPFPEVSRTIFSTLSPKSNHSGSFFPMMLKKFITNIDEEKIIIFANSFCFISDSMPDIQARQKKWPHLIFEPSCSVFLASIISIGVFSFDHCKETKASHHT